jgi:formate-dependent phosphoribosylglycinamide formyltransferase (GAR transformylase)
VAREINYITTGWDVVQLLVNMALFKKSKNNHLMAVKISAPLGQRAKKVLLCGSGEPGREVAIELQRLGVAGIPEDDRPSHPCVTGRRRMSAALATDGRAEQARKMANKCTEAVDVDL